MGGYDSFRPQTTNTNWHRFSCPECGKQCKICSESADYFDYSGVTNSDGYLLLEVDARIWELVQQQYENLTEGIGPNNNERVPIKETTTRVTGNVAKNSYAANTLYPFMTFNYDLTSQGVYDFIAMTFERSFSLKHNIELEFIVSDGTPLINLPENLETNEINNHEIIVNLEDYITDYDNSFDELDISIIEEEWSAADASIEVDDNELIVHRIGDFFPDYIVLDLSHSHNNVIDLLHSIIPFFLGKLSLSQDVFHASRFCRIVCTVESGHEYGIHTPAQVSLYILFLWEWFYDCREDTS